MPSVIQPLRHLFRKPRCHLRFPRYCLLLPRLPPPSRRRLHPRPPPLHRPPLLRLPLLPPHHSPTSSSGQIVSSTKDIRHM